jgi:hypothetical protein
MDQVGQVQHPATVEDEDQKKRVATQPIDGRAEAPACDGLAAGRAVLIPADVQGKQGATLALDVGACFDVSPLCFGAAPLAALEQSSPERATNEMPAPPHRLPRTPRPIDIKMSRHHP